MKVLAYTSPARGHLNPIMPPLLELARRGVEIHVRTISSSVDGVRAEGLEAEPIDPRIEAIEIDDHAQGSQIKRAQRAYAVWAERAALEPSDVGKAIAAIEPDVLLIDTNTFGARAEAERSGLPWAEFRPFLLEDPAPGKPPFGLGLAPRDDLVGKVRDAIAHRIAAKFGRDHILPTINAGRRAAGLDELGTLEVALRRAPLTVYFTAEPFEYPRPALPGVVAVGPCPWEPEQELDAELDGRPLVLVTCSSEFQDDADIARAALAGLAADYQVVVTSAGVDPATLPAPDGAIVRRFLPHSKLLERASTVVCHGGMGITQKALSYGVPTVVVPWGRDQLDVAAHVEHAEAGAVVPRKKLSGAAIAAAVAKAESRRAGAERVAQGYRRAGGAARAADAIEELAGRPAGAAAAARTEPA